MTRSGARDTRAREYPLRAPGWETIPDLVHGFLGRRSSLAAGAFTVADLHTHVRSAGEGPAAVLALRQVHGARVVGSDELEACRSSWESASLPHALPAGDALVTACADVVLTVRTADCVPVLLVAPRARAVAAVHAGWRGVMAGVIANAVGALRERYAAKPVEIRAAIGPAIGGCCYEFGAEHRATFRERLGPAAERAWRERAGRRPHLDLPTLCRVALEAVGVEAAAIAEVGPCTAEHPEELHSYRRDGPAAGRQLSYIGWRA